MNRNANSIFGLAIAATSLALAACTGSLSAETMTARRTAMGGVVLPGGGLGSDVVNVAYRAVPSAPGTSSGVSLPIGLVQLLADPPVLDPDDPEFNVYELANTFYNIPWNLQLVSPEPPSNDIVVELGRDHLAVQLGEISRMFPDDHSRFGALTHTPSLGFGVRQFFVGLSGLAEYENDLSMNDALHRVLAEGEEFRTNTEYAMFDEARGQAAASLQLGWARAVMTSGNPREPGGSALYVGTRTRLLRGLAYGDARNVVAFTTRDTLFSSAPIDLQYAGAFRTAGPGDAGWGRGLDLGVVWLGGGFEIGLGLNDIATRIDWRVEESVTVHDSATGDYQRQVVRTDVPYTSEVPQVTTFNVAKTFGRVLVAADVTRGRAGTSGHVGVETWMGLVALRSGASVDENQLLQCAGGVGVRLGRVGADLALATHSRNLSRERGLELAAGLSFYR